MKVLWILLLPMAFWTEKAALIGKSTLLKINYGYLVFANLERQYFAGIYSQLMMMFHSKHGRFNLHNTPFHQVMEGTDTVAGGLQTGMTGLGKTDGLKEADSSANRIECFHSRDQHLCKFIGTKESVCIRKEFNSQRIGLGHQHGRRDVM